MPAKKERRIGGDVTREIVKDVLLILGASAPNDATQRRRLEQTIRFGLRYPRQETITSGRFGVRTDKQKRAAAKAEAAIRKLRIVLKDQNLVRHHWLDEDPDRVDAHLEALQHRYQTDAQKPLQERRYRAIDWSVRNAARAAAKICNICGLPLSIGRNSQFVRISAVICGRVGVDLRRVCDTVRRELS